MPPTLRLEAKMQAVAVIPPFERFYLEQRDIVLGFLRRRLGAQAAEDAFQETFLRALRAYDRLEHGDHLRAWVLTIAARLVIDTSRRARPVAPELPELPVEDGRPEYAQIEHLADRLPPTERAAVVLRYAYDLAYDDIALALDSTPEAARQAASSGVRRLRTGRIHDRLA
jgi:RNA polymerase sigma factor (sigma-70 family)